MKYYITKADEMVGPLEMKKPNTMNYCGGQSNWNYIEANKKWEQHLASLPPVKHRLPNKAGDIVDEKDFEWREEVWMPQTEEEYHEALYEARHELPGGIPKVKVAVPKERKELLMQEDEESFTPEEILEKHGLINGFAVEAFTERVVAAMEEYAKQFKSPESFTREDMIGFAEAYRPMRQKALDECAGDKQKWIETIDRPTSYWLAKYLTNKKQ